MASNNWSQKIDLSDKPTAPEKLEVKLESATNILTLGGTSETKTAFRTSRKTWSQQVRIPKEVDTSTISVTMADNILTISADYDKTAAPKPTPSRPSPPAPAPTRPAPSSKTAENVKMPSIDVPNLPNDGSYNPTANEVSKMSNPNETQ